jgi:hypothetical protein
VVPVRPTSPYARSSAWRTPPINAIQSAGAERDHRGRARRQAGRGFAVVAHEVKALATQTANFTAEGDQDLSGSRQGKIWSIRRPLRSRRRDRGPLACSLSRRCVEIALPARCTRQKRTQQGAIPARHHNANVYIHQIASFILAIFVRVL